MAPPAVERFGWQPVCVLSNRPVGSASVGVAAVLTVAGVLLLLSVGWPVAGSDGSSVTELRLARLVLTAPLWTALLVLGAGSLALVSSRTEPRDD